MTKNPERKSEVPEGEELGGDEEVIVEAGEVTDPDRPPCPQCGWHNTRLSHTRSGLDKILRAFSIRAFRCRTCGNRFRAKRRTPKE